MKLTGFVTMGVILLVVFGCSGGKHIRREDYPAQGNHSAKPVGLRAYQSGDGSFDGKLNLLYEKEIKGSADSPLQVLGDFLVFRTTRDRVLAIDQATGKRKARFKTRRGIVLDPVVIDSFLVIVRKSTYGEIEVVNILDGSTIRKRVLREIRSGPGTVMNTVIFGTTAGLVALGIPELNLFWQSEAERSVVAAPVTDANTVYYTVAADGIRAVDPNDGDSLWERRFDASVVSELSAGQFLYCGLSDGRLVALNKATGETEWETPLGYQVRGGVAETDQAVFTGCTDGAVYRLSRSTGSVIWRCETEGIITASPVVYDSSVVIGSHDRHVYSIEAATGQIIDRRRVESAVILGAAVAGKRIFITCRKERLYCFEG